MHSAARCCGLWAVRLARTWIQNFNSGLWLTGCVIGNKGTFPRP